ncbi:conserved hypothetical protein [Arthrobacter sp. Hiyo4]|nr:conserved hypothetical protein [Arthrobacter sp. Hiyo4]
MSVCSAFCTVTGLAWYSATNDRVEGSFAPGAAEEIHFFRCATIRELLSLFMRDNSSATTLLPPVIPFHQPTGLWWGLAGVAAFSFTVPFTKVAVESLSPLFIGSGRAVVAAILAAFALALTRQRLPAALSGSASRW